MNNAVLKIFNILKDGKYHWLDEMAKESGQSEAGTSARIRDLRKAEFGGYIVERQNIMKDGRRQYRYRLFTREAYNGEIAKES